MPQSDLDQIHNFLEYLQFQKRYSLHTISAYQTDLEDFYTFLQKEYGESPVNPTPSQIRSWLASLRQADMKPKSINRKMSSLKSFFKYLLRNSKIASSPMANITSLKVNKRLPSFIEEKDINTLFTQVEFPDTWQGKTDKLLLSIFYQCGVRVSELLNLKDSSIDSGNGSLKVLGKGNKERLIPINNDLIHQIEIYQNEKKNRSIKTSFLLINEKGNPFTRSSVYVIVNKYLSMVSTNEKRSPHILRHSFATHLTNHGADINAIKELLGHSSLASTQVYTSNSIEKLKDIHKLAHPKA